MENLFYYIWPGNNEKNIFVNTYFTISYTASIYTVLNTDEI